MYQLLNLKKNLVAGLVLSGSVAVAAAASSLTKTGVEYPIMHSLARDQVLPHLSLGPTGGYIVAQDATVDGNGSGIRGRRIYSDLSAFRATFAVNTITAGNQENARVAMVPSGGAAFAWQSSTSKGHRIYVRFLSQDETFTDPEFPASEVMEGHQSSPAIAVLADNSVVVVWEEENRDSSMKGVFGQRFTATGTRLGTTFRVNTVTYLNQRTPTIAALADGGFVVAWVSEEFRQRGTEFIDIAARIFSANGTPLGNDFALNTKGEICANPALAATSSGFRAAWSSRAIQAINFVNTSSNEVVIVNGLRITNQINVVTRNAERSINSWDVSTRLFDAQGNSSAAEVVVNAIRKGDQHSPRLLNFRNRELVLWTSYGQDRSDEGIYGRVLIGTGFEGSEFLVPTETSFAQIHPAVAALNDRIVIAWSSFRGAAEGFDIVGQQYTMTGDDSLVQPPAPFLSSLNQRSILVSWPEIGSAPVDVYRVHVDNETVPVETIGGMVTITRDHWTPGSTHSVRLSYRLQDGRVSPISEPASVVTWGADDNNDGIPDDWQKDNWGKVWPSPQADSDGDGASNLAEFLAGTDPTNPTSVLRVQLSPREQGMYIQWQTTPGYYYQVQYTSDFSSWTDVGTARFAPSTMDSVAMQSAGTTQYYRVIRLR